MSENDTIETVFFPEGNYLLKDGKIYREEDGELEAFKEFQKVLDQLLSHDRTDCRQDDQDVP